jgi:hypothetical protein
MTSYQARAHEIAVTIAIAIPVAISPYSIAETPELSRKNFRTILAILVSFVAPRTEKVTSINGTIV